MVNLVFYVVFLSCLTALALLLQYRSSEILVVIHTLRWTVIILSVIQLLKELTQLLHLKWLYLQSIDNWMEVPLYTISILSIVVYGEHAHTQRTPSALRGLMALSVFLAWSILVLYLRRSFVLGTYIIMMIKIIKTLLKIVALMLPFVCAYGIPFFIIFSIPELPPCLVNGVPTGNDVCTNTTSTDSTHYLFSDIPLSIWTTFMLLLGEMKYPHTLYKYQPLPFPYVTYLIYITLVMCMPIIIKNLMIGLSVGDVKRIVEFAKHKHLLSQVDMLIDIDKTLPSFIHRRMFVDHVIEYPLRQKSLTLKFLSIGFPNIVEQRTAKEERLTKSDIEQMGSTMANLAVRMQDQET
ncbi:hypothetical protein QZH41_011656, partial [Actinostola sp. cb2023]